MTDPRSLLEQYADETAPRYQGRRGEAAPAVFAILADIQDCADAGPVTTADIDRITRHHLTP